jgi:hypothetical protein
MAQTVEPHGIAVGVGEGELFSLSPHPWSKRIEQPRTTTTIAVDLTLMIRHLDRVPPTTSKAAQYSEPEYAVADTVSARTFATTANGSDADRR